METTDIREQWMAEANKQTLDTLPAFLSALKDHQHDYNTCVYATAAAMVGTMWAMNEHLGLTGFQSGGVGWEVMRKMHSFDGPAKLVLYENMLFPQYERKFQRTIDQDTADWLKDEAAKKLATGSGSDEVRAHWQTIVDGRIPFGYTVAPS